MKVHEACKLGFGLHQTFPPRFGWLKKAFDQANAKSTIFSDSDATVELGVGKNMVDAIAFWSQAFRILKTEQPTKKAPAAYSSTPFGQLLFSETGLDPYLELPQSLWLLHWMAIRPGGRLPVWWLTFASFSQYEFSTEALADFVLEETSTGPWGYSNEKPILKDIDCLIRMYSPKMAKTRTSLDDYLDSPFRDLGLIVPSSIDRNSYRFQVGPKPGLDDLVVLLACLDFMLIQGTKSLTVPRLATDVGSPGRVLKLNEPSITHSLNQVIGSVEGVVLASPAGVPQLITEVSIPELIRIVLNLLYPDRLITVELGEVFAILEPSQEKPALPARRTKAASVSKAQVSQIDEVDMPTLPKSKKTKVKPAKGKSKNDKS